MLAFRKSKLLYVLCDKKSTNCFSALIGFELLSDEMHHKHSKHAVEIFTQRQIFYHFSDCFKS
jgi:hypothetical protein